MAVTVEQLAEVMRDHWPYRQPVSQSWASCPGCGHQYTAEAPECPTAAAVRPLLLRRCNEAPKALSHDERKALAKPPADLAVRPRRVKRIDRAPAPTAGLFEPPSATEKRSVSTAHRI